ncbi:transglycosylase SLT domain-containing protein [uncultured Cardiobacterium sp.]|uniref:lytic transglycosylase domain-containing protein n=1 Tax=uncultured Cardiobacterium sp. TaxID=417619 RepID=UPI00261F906A|nr:transglycosylase SLT domain-containing protein [uncultured Cardiobacterium sp.]
MGSNEPIPPQDSTPVALRAEVDENWPPPKFKPVTYKAMSARRLSYAGQIMRVANANGVEVELAHAIITQESVYKLKARSDGVGAMGLMQLMPDTARRWKCYQPYDAECNLNAGNRYLRFLADRYNGNIRTIAAGYNAGEGTADSYLHGTRLKGKNSGIKTPNGVPLASFAYTPKQRARCPSNNWHPTPDCEGQTFDYVRSVLGYYLTYKQHPELIGKTVEPAPSAVAHRQGRI